MLPAPRPRERLVRASLFCRRAVRGGRGSLLVLALGAWVAMGGATAPLGPWAVLATCAWAGLLAVRLRDKLFRRAGPPHPPDWKSGAPTPRGRFGEAPLRVDLELGALLAVGLDAGLLRYGGLSGPLSPAVYVLVAVVAAFARPLAGLLVVGWVVVLEAAIRRFALGEASLAGLLPHAGFVAAFALLNLAFLRAEVARIRLTARVRIEQELARLKEDARRYRLLAAGEESHQDERSEDRLARSSVEEIHESVHYALDLLRRTLGLHTAVLLWLNDAGTHLCISELSSASDEIHDVPFPAQEGVLGAAVMQRASVALHDLKPSAKVPYYVGPCPVRALAAIPVLEGETLRGLLAIDRADNRPLSPQEEELAAQAARYCQRAIQNERIFIQLERSKVEQGKLYRAAQALGAARSEKEVVEAGVRSAREIARIDLAAVTLYDDAAKHHEVVAATSADGSIDDLVGARFAPNAGLVAMVVKNRYPLPYRGEFDAGRQIVLTRRFPWPKVPSLLVLPLMLQGRVLGTLILGARRRHAFGDSVRPTLEVLASHLAVSLANARMVRELETMATTDGLTGLLNKRAMLDAAAQRVAAAARFGRKLSLLIADIDHFKKVNDTYGHDVGDLVIRGLADILKRQKRTTDLVARFGGEEFVALCEQTDEAGAMLLAERIREELKRTVFHPGSGLDGRGPHPAGAGSEALRVTCSIGIATFPEAGRGWDPLFKSADEALYTSKHQGRDRCTAWLPPKAQEPPGSRRKAG